MNLKLLYFSGAQILQGRRGTWHIAKRLPDGVRPPLLRYFLHQYSPSTVQSSVILSQTPRVLKGNRLMEFQSNAEQRVEKNNDRKSVSTDGISESLMPHLLNLYGSRASAKDFEIYATNAIFEDPLMCAHGVKQIKSAFYSLPKVFSDSRIVEYSLKAYAAGSGNTEVLIENKQYYKIFGKDLYLESLIKLKLEQGKIVRHEDWWDKKPPKSRETAKLPILGRFAETARRGSMLVTHALMAFGKDPS